MATERLNIVVSLKNKASAGLLKVQKQFSIFGRNAEGASKKVAAFAKNMATKFGPLAAVASAVAFGIAKIGSAALKAAGQFEQFRVQFDTMLGSAEKSKKLLEDIEKFSAATPFQLPNLVEGAQRLIAFGIEADEVVDKLKNLGNAAGGNSEKLNRLTLAFGKLRAKGKATLEEINMFTEAGVPLIDQLAKNYGVTTQEMFQMISTGKVGFKEVDEAITSLTTGAGKFAGLIEKQAKTFPGLVSTMKDNIGLLAKDFGELLLPAAKAVVRGLTSMIKVGRVLGKVIVSAVKAPIDAVIWTMQLLRNIVFELIDIFIDWFLSFAPIQEALNFIQESIQATIDVFNNLKDSILEIFDEIVAIYEEFIERLKNIPFIQKVLPGIKEDSEGKLAREREIEAIKNHNKKMADLQKKRTTEEKKAFDARRKLGEEWIGSVNQYADQELTIAENVARGTLEFVKKKLIAQARAFAEAMAAEGAGQLAWDPIGGGLKIAGAAVIAGGAPAAIGTIQLADGGSMIVDRPTGIGSNVIAGEAGPERIDVTPLDEQRGGDVTVNIDGRTMAREMYEIQTDMINTGELAER